jgi:hypothetical protein
VGASQDSIPFPFLGGSWGFLQVPGGVPGGGSWGFWGESWGFLGAVLGGFLVQGLSKACTIPLPNPLVQGACANSFNNIQYPWKPESAHTSDNIHPIGGRCGGVRKSPIF